MTANRPLLSLALLLTRMAEADARFHQTLVEAYGEKRAGDMRYLRFHPDHPEVQAAGDAYVAASKAWHDAASTPPINPDDTSYTAMCRALAALDLHAGEL